MRLVGYLGVAITAALFFIDNAILGSRVSWASTMLLVLLATATSTASFLLISRGRRLAAPSAYDILAEDGRSVVAYLRSFASDQGEAMGQLTTLLGLPGSTDEQVITDVLARVGPVIAIGRPGERLPALGAARLYVGEDEWQNTVTEILARSALVVVRSGDTNGLAWEVERIAKSACQLQRSLGSANHWETSVTVTVGRSMLVRSKVRLLKLMRNAVGEREPTIRTPASSPRIPK